MNSLKFLVKLSILTVFILIISCNPYRYFDLELLQPAEMVQPLKINYLFVIEPGAIKINPTVNTDWMYYKRFWQFYNKALAQKLSESPLFENTSVKYSNDSDFIRWYMYKPFNERKKINVCLIRADFLNDTSYKNLDFDENPYISYNVSKTIRISYGIKLAYFNLANFDNDLFVKHLSDTIYWDGLSIYSNMFTSNYFSNTDSSIATIAKNAAFSMAQTIAPCWQKQERFLYYKNNKYMRKGYKDFVSNNIEQAVNNWEIVYFNGTKNIASKAAYNISVVYESLDSVKLAKQWADSAANQLSSKEIVNYQQYLKFRIQEKDSLNKQLMKKYF